MHNFKYALLVLSIFFGNIANCQLDPMEANYPTPTKISNDDYNKMEYDRCTGTLNIALESTKSTTGGFWPIKMAFVYIKIGGQWKKLVDIFAMQHFYANGCNSLSAGTDPSDNYCGTSNQAGRNWNPEFYSTLASANPARNDLMLYPKYGSGSAPPATAKRIAHISGAYLNTWWGMYDDKNICSAYDANLNLISNSQPMDLVAWEDAPRLDTDHASDIQNNLGKIGFYPSDGTEWGLQFGITNIPPEAMVGDVINVRIWKWTGHKDNFNPADKNWENSYQVLELATSVNAVDAPFGLSASDDVCDTIKLNWQVPTQTWSSTLNCTNNMTYKNVIYRDGVKIAVVDGDVTTYNDIDNNGTNNLVPRTEYDYTVKTILWNRNSKTFRSSSSSNLVKGSMKLPPDQPGSFSATRDNCDTLISLSWVKTAGVSPAQYKVYRAPASGGADALVATLTGGKRAYDDKAITRGVDYRYRLVAFNDCGFPSDTAEVTGKSPADPAAATNVTVTLNAAQDTATVTWTDAAYNETKYQVERQDDEGNVVLYDLNKVNGSGTTVTFKDGSIVGCKTYEYAVRTINDCVQSGIKSTEVSTGLIPPPNLSSSFTATKKLTASKGYYNNRVELSFSYNNGGNLDLFNIYRKVLGSGVDSTLIGTADQGEGLYVDNTADAGTFYKYTIVGVKYCSGSEILSNTSEDIGFRSPTGIVNGHIEYTGGVAVKNVKVSVEPVSAAIGNAIKLNGTNYVAVPNNATNLGVGDTIAVEAWVNSTANTPVQQSVINKGTTYNLKYNYTTSQVEFSVNLSSGLQTVTYPFSGGIAGNITTNTYNHVCGTYNGSYVKLFVNGEAVDSVAATGTISHVTDSIKIGQSIVGYVDEIRVWNRTRTNLEIKRDYSMMKNGDEGGIVLLLHADEGATKHVFDISKTGNTFNENHGNFSPQSSFEWTPNIPTKSQLGYAGYTDANGDYTVSGVRYTQTGANYKVTPYLDLGGVHVFSPGNTVLYLGDGSNVQNGVDFEDESSFRVQGNVRYKGTTCPAKDVMLYVDGEPVITNGQVEMTDASGNFDIQVPIGNHFITTEKNGHIFSAGRYPAAENTTHDFQYDLTGLQFIDSTFQIVTGRVVGGTVESAKLHIPGRSKNNIGQADITFQTLDGCHSVSVTTVDTSGEYTVLLPPMKYSVPNFAITSNPAIMFNNNPLLDVSPNLPLQADYDTIYIGNSIDHIDSSKYHKIMDFIHRSTPQISVVNPDSTAGIEPDTLISYVDNATEDTIEINLNTTPFPFGVFSQHRIYETRIYAFEQYVNKDAGAGNWVYDNVAVLGGDLTITNNLATNSVTTISLQSGDTLYSFKAGQPATSYNAVDNDENFTKSFNVQLSTPSATVNWYPSGAFYPTYNGLNEVYLGYVKGGKSADGQAFAAQGPQVVTHILRDPPGSESFAYLEAGSSVTRTESWEMNESVGVDLNKNISLGTEFTVGLGVQTPTKIENDLTLNTQIETSFNQSGEKEETITINETWQTNAAPEQVGAGSDLYIGRTMNSNFGVAWTIGLVEENVCSMQGVDCIPSSVTKDGKNYKIAKRKTLWMVPGGYSTMFMFDQNAIVNYIIPDLEALRNQVFIDKANLYTLNFTDLEDPKYGTNNDDPVWGTAVTSATVSKTETVDYSGPSYTYDFAGSGNKPDTIRWFNQQIRLWKEAIKMNERLKYEAKLVDNFSANGGVTYDKNVTLEKVETTGFAFEMGLTETATLEISAKVGGSGVGVEQGLSVAISGGKSNSESQTNTTTYGYTFFDPEQGDFHSVDVKDAGDGWGPVFSMQAGKTSCPYEGKQMSLYYTDGGQPVELSGGTLQREIPELEIEGSVFAKKVNIPSGEKAVFNLRLINSSATGDDMIYTITVLEETNPNGAQLTIDGYEASGRDFTVPGGSSINKTLEIARGPIEFSYDSIGIILRSPCQFAFGTSDEEDIADTVYVSVEYLPTCTESEITSPLDQWVVNNSFDDTLDLVFQGYDINFYGYDNLTFEYKPSAQASWIPLQTWYMDTSGMNGALPISQVNPYTLYEWDLLGAADGPYDIRAKTQCKFNGMSDVDRYSPIFSGIIDRINPHPFGNPQPADGILSPNDEIMIQFNEPVDLGLINTYNFDIRGVLNGADVRHDASLYFDGVDDNVKIANGVDLKGSSTIEMYVKRNRLNTDEIIFSQGINADQTFEIGFNAANQITVKNANISYNTTSATAVINDNLWHHIAVSYNDNNNIIEVFIDGALEGNSAMFADYTEGGDIYIGKSANSSLTFEGYVHELRIWNKISTASEIVVRMNKSLSGREFGIVGVWPMDEAIGGIVEDKARNRHGIIDGANWTIFPSGQVASFDGVDSYADYNTSQMAFTNEMDFTIEFWYNATTQTDSACLFSNGFGDDNLTLAIYTDASGKMFVKNNNINTEVISSNTFDGGWHHFAMVVRRASNTSFYLDGELTKSIPSANLGQFGSPSAYFGARGYYVGSVLNVDQYFTGMLDEIRIWNLSRKQEQIQRDRVNRLNGDEFGLKLYLPFEEYVDNLGVPTLTAAYTNIVDNTSAVDNGGTSLTGTNVPNIKLPRPISAIPYTFSVNGDKIIITPNIDPAQIENVTLDITVENIPDLNGNRMQSPKTWIAYVDKNQVVWEDTQHNISIPLEGTYSFDAKILNIGGSLKQYTISNLPNWLTASHTSGSVAPNSFTSVTFEVVQGVNIGSYEQDIYLTTDFGFDEKLNVKLKVTAESPNWTVDPADYQYSMSIIGRIRVDGIISTDPEDKLVALVDDEVRGIANLEYYEDYDAYLVFMDVYSNVVGGEDVKFYVWDASAGKTHIEVTPNLVFQDNDLVGVPNNPQTFDAINIISAPIVLKKGWNWVSFNLESPNQHDVNKLLYNIKADDADIIKSIDKYDQYSSTIGWVGSITSDGGVNIEESYKIRTSYADTVDYFGSKVTPADVKIPIDSGWNWIGFVALKNVSVPNAFGNYNVNHGDLIKGQTSFAVYDTILGWVGNLDYMIPNKGYMFRSSKKDTLIYPNSAVFEYKTLMDVTQLRLNRDYGLSPEDFQYTMNLIGQIDICERHHRIETIIAYVDDEVRGVSKVMDNKVFMTIYSNGQNENLTYKLVDISGGTINVAAGNKFMNNFIEGTTDTPFVLKAETSIQACEEPKKEDSFGTSTIAEENYVNLRSTLIENEIGLIYNFAEGTALNVDLYGIDGKYIANICNYVNISGEGTVEWKSGSTNLRLAPGIYLLKMTYGDKVQTERIIKPIK